MIHVYDIGNTNYTGNGNAVLQPTECRLRNIAGGNYDLTMTHPIDPEGKWKHLVPGAIIKAPVPREEIENAYAGYDADVYKTTAQAELRESASEPTSISYPEWNPNNPYEVGSKVRVSTWSHKNYQCTYYDGTSGQIMVPPYNSSWWKPIADQTGGAPVLVTLPEGTDLYFIEDYDTNWYKMSTYYGVVGYIKKDKVQYDRHLTPSETQPRIITEQLFRIEKPTVDTKSRTVTLTAKHVSYDLAGILVQNVSIAQASPAMALGRIVEGFMMDYEGTIATDMQTADYGTYTGDIKGKNGIFALLDPDKGIVSTFNAAYKRDNWDLFVLTKETVDRGYRLKYRKNMLGVNWAQDASGLVTRVVPVAKDEKGENLYLPEKWVDSPLINTYPRVRMEQLPVKGQVGKDKGTGDGSTWTESDLLNEMRTKAAERFSVDEADKITVTVTVDFEQLGDAEEHQELKGMETVLLYDRVTVENEEIGLSVQLYVSEWEWDAIRKKITSLKLANTTDYKKGSVTGYNVQNKSIGSEKLTDEVTGEILQQAVDIMPEYAEPFDSQTHLNTKDQDGIVTKGSGQANKVWKTDGQGNPAWRDEQTVTGFIPTSEKGAPGGVATLDNAGKVPASELPSYVDDVLEYASKSAFPATGETGKIYVAIDTGKTYRWSGSTYIELSNTAVTDNDPTLAWGTRSKVGTVAGTDLHVTMPGNPTDGVAEDTSALTDSDYALKVGSPSKKVTFLRVWNYIKDKISSVLGLTATNYGGKAATAGTADSANAVAWNNVTDKPGSFYTLPLAANGTRGGVQIGYSGSGKNYPVQLDNEKMYVNVPWTDNDHHDWGDITNKPATATRWPAWSEVTDKPNEFAPSDNSGYYTLWDGDLASVLGANSEAAICKSYFENDIPARRVVVAYNTSGTEYTLIFSKGGSSAVGTVLKFGYYDRYIRILRQLNGWQSTEWEKTGAGFADMLAFTAASENDCIPPEHDRFKVFRCTSSTTGYGDGYIMAFNWSSGYYCTQIFTDVDANYALLYRYRRDNGNWDAWKRIPMGDGTGASGTWSIDISGNAATVGNADTVDSEHASAFVHRRESGASYDQLGYYYGGGAMPTYVRVGFDPNAATWAMMTFEFTIRRNYSTGEFGKLYVYGNWSSADNWNTFYAVCDGRLSNVLKVYGSDKRYIYIEGLTVWGGLTLDKVTVGDSLTGYDISQFTFDVVSALPATYQTATMYYGITTENIGSQSVAYAASAGEGQSGTIPVNPTYCTGTISYKAAKIAEHLRVVNIQWDVTFNGSYSSDNVAVMNANTASEKPVPIGGGNLVICSGISAVLGSLGIVNLDGSYIKPWYCGTISGHWVGSATYIAL